MLESVKKRLDEYDISTPPDLQSLADVMIMLCIRPVELISLRITNAGMIGYMKNRGQEDIPRDFRLMEKDSEQAKELAKNLAHAMTIAGEALHHSPYNNTSPAQNYIVVNYRRKNQSPEQARPFQIYNNN
ncbi:hypothetical protein Glove_546g6 [Diversispora epigaea]|uniref:Uncharacterized protein n=1 Tax=Diversispora epigaea TaxID=1348612 RepID=A0A397GC20_9GLOM|nr:hypothetical protein Glove_546g6 [Diversispora epigaea]